MNAGDLRYIFDRLDRGHVSSCASQARYRWDHAADANTTNSFEVCYQPGDGTHYGLVFTVLVPRMPVVGAPGGGTGGHIPSTITGCSFDGSFVLVYYVQRNRGMFLGRRDFVHPAYVEANLGELTASCLALSVLFNEITEASPGWEKRMIENAQLEED